MPNSRDHNSHSAFSHDSIESFGYDWDRVGDPSQPPRYPLKLYLPRTTADVVRAVEEVQRLGQRLLVRSKGHSSNDLVVADGGAVLCTELMTRIDAPDEQALAVTVQSGAPLADIDDQLSRRGFGLPIIGDHNHITAGGFAAVGGANAASHRFGLFVDNVRAMEYVTWDGAVRWCSRTEDPAQLARLLMGLGRHGVITTLVLDIIRVDKMRTVLRNQRTFYRDADRFVKETAGLLAEPGDATYVRGLWADVDKGRGKPLLIGQFSRYVETPASARKALHDRVAYGWLHAIGRRAGTSTGTVALAVRQLGIAGLLVSPRYATMKNVEIFVDRILDSTTAEPNRWLAAFVPIEQYGAMFRRCYDTVRDYRTRHRCFTGISLYLKSVRSPYLAHGDPTRRFAELVIHFSCVPERLSPALWSEIAGRIDDACVELGAFRYMHTRTGRDPAVLRRIDPNAMYADDVSLPGEATPGVAAPDRALESGSGARVAAN
jgi:FAD/FMN-containing dehydrogenase